MERRGRGEARRERKIRYIHEKLKRRLRKLIENNDEENNDDDDHDVINNDAKKEKIKKIAHNLFNFRLLF